VHEAENLSLGAIGRLLEASEEIRFGSGNRQEVYGWVKRLLVQREYSLQSKAARGLIRRYIEKMTGLSRAQVTRRILEREFRSTASRSMRGWPGSPWLICTTCARASVTASGV